MEISTIPEYEKDVKHLKKRFHTIEEDLDLISAILKVKPDQRPPFSQRIEGLGVRTCIIKVKKIACRALKGKGVNSGLRLVYAFFPQELKIVLVELYYKSDQEKENRDRIFKHFK